MENKVVKNKARPSAIVIGGSSGIGYETCLRLVNRGWAVTNISRTACNNARVVNICADVAQGSSVSDAINSSAQSAGLTALIYCAGFSMAAPIEYAKESDYKYLFEVNYFGAIRAMQAAIPHLKRKGGKIILVGSLGGDIPIIYDSFYSSSKAALEMLAKEANTELKQFNIRVTALLPGGTATNFSFKRKIYSDSDNKGYAPNLNKAVAALCNMEQSGMKAARVAEDIYKLLEADSIPAVKTCGTKNAIIRTVSRIMPDGATMYVNDKVYHQ
jgi:NAD(P)-dependent dehydrogenase (short-subunit alcohol dehydrogenase family)